MNSRNQPGQRRVGTFTLGIVLVASGLLMACSLFWPELDLSWVLKGAPLILILLGVETLLAARGGTSIKYDWAGMLLCFFLTAAALLMYLASWWLLYSPFAAYCGSIESDEYGCFLEYSSFHTTQDLPVTPEAG